MTNLQHNLQQLVAQEFYQLDACLHTLESRLNAAPPGRLRVKKSGGRVEYYHALSRKHISYIPKANMKLIRQLAQKGYDKKAYAKICQRIAVLRQFQQAYESTNIMDLYYKNYQARVNLIEPVIKSWEHLSEEWCRQDYEKLVVSDDIPTIYTNRGERVRSKSEKIMADFFSHHNIPYKYEKPLRLAGAGKVYPDFTILSPRTGKEIYWEHFGKMDDPSYAQNAVSKIMRYAECGYHIGDRLLMTFETSRSGIDTPYFEGLVQHYLMP